MNFKRYVEASDTWVDSHYIMGTSTDTITTLPADIYANDTTARVGLKGDMSQSGTPSPDSPIQPQECGERTANLWFFQPNTERENVTIVWDGEKLVFSGTATSAANVISSSFTLPKGTYTLKANANRIPANNTYACIDIYKASPFFQKVIPNNSATNGTVSFTIADDIYVVLRIRIDNGANYDGFTLRPMLNVGEESLPYEPYGYKIPILSANTTIPIYLGEVQSTRRIKKLVLTGNENWDRQMPQHTTVINLYCPVTGATPNSPIVSNIALYSPRAGGDNDSYVNVGKINTAGTNLLVDLSLSDFSTTGAFKSYLQQQYAAGTPVTVWYVLATPTTGIINEPLRKIGDYADTVSGITIPTIAGANTLSIGTTLQPSEVTVNYKGWHPVSAVHERENGAWT